MPRTCKLGHRAAAGLRAALIRILAEVHRYACSVDLHKRNGLEERFALARMARFTGSVLGVRRSRISIYGC